jgi:hypothetical protein
MYIRQNKHILVVPRHMLSFLVLLVISRTSFGTITVIPSGDMVQINAGGLPATQVGESSILWQFNNPMRGTLFYVNKVDPVDPTFRIFRATTTDGGKTWTPGVSTGLSNPSAISQDERNPVVRDLHQTGILTGFFGTKQGTFPPPFGPNEILFRAASDDNGITWPGSSLITFNSGAFPGHTGLNGFVEVFQTSSGILRGYVAMNNINDGQPYPSATHLVESSDDGATWFDIGNIQIPGPGGFFNVVGANGPVFTFKDSDNNQTKMGWFVFGDGPGNRGVRLLISSDEGLSWAPSGFVIQDSNMLSGDANFMSDSLVRLFYHRGANPDLSNQQFYYQDFTFTGMTDIQPNNIFVNQPPTANAGPDQTVSAGSNCQAVVPLNGMGSSDPDGDPLTYTWTNSFGTATGATPSVTLPLGTHTVTLTVSDGSSTATDTVAITVVDTNPPAINGLVVNPAVLWPPNHKMVPVNLAVSATDNCAATPTCRIISVGSNEPVSPSGDWEFAGDLKVNLRAERLGSGSGRTYTLTIRCTDNAGNGATTTATVTVPPN